MTPLHQRQIHELHSLDRGVKLLSTHGAWLLGLLVMGCDGVLSGAGSVIANLQVALWEAVQSDDLKRARQLDNSMTASTRRSAPFTAIR